MSAIPYRELTDDGTTHEKARKPMIVMPSNSTGWVWHCLARETSRLGHLISPTAERGPWPWFPYALDNGAFACWNPRTNVDEDQWKLVETRWRNLLLWAQFAPTRPLWAIVPDVPGNGPATIERWKKYAGEVVAAGIPLAVAVQDGMTCDDVWELDPQPEVICVGGSTEWKWESVWLWCHDFPRVHLLRCNSPTKLNYLEDIGCESTDGTGWNRGYRPATRGLEEWCRARAKAMTTPLWPYTCRKEKNQLTLA